VLERDDLVGFVSTTSPQRAREFYEGLLGLRLCSESPFALVFDANGTMLRVTTVAELVIAPYTVLGWRVPDIAETVRALGARGVAFLRFEGMDQDELGIWTTPGGDRVAWFHDPDGNTLSLTHFARP
jgi:catechol 2,3-dioxygenase-like lactoylglutathione lyase family enzyme